MWCRRVQCALALLTIALAVLTVGSAPSDGRYRGMLKRLAAGTRGKAELEEYSLAQLLAELANAENEALDADDVSRAAQEDEVRMELERSANPNLAQRERKAGCKNFFWKTFTSC
ncbi:somatostatin 1, tandem duplicate 1 [Pristis pectinata]|uniref:somatostatin 1, tandem duplicate 1 n=1 Tax=Pristis pectinata TaxID=685728 RepID=UPI00223C9915|nr:somatostatin 1, tandem duplicate 1 [Pristis pectinata]